jgi:hypothetical protein
MMVSKSQYGLTADTLTMIEKTELYA